jgi:hypothetical protein
MTEAKRTARRKDVHKWGRCMSRASVEAAFTAPCDDEPFRYVTVGEGLACTAFSRSSSSCEPPSRNYGVASEHKGRARDQVLSSTFQLDTRRATNFSLSRTTPSQGCDGN